jgi:hypothetical protein
MSKSERRVGANGTVYETSGGGTLDWCKGESERRVCSTLWVDKSERRPGSAGWMYKEW